MMRHFNCFFSVLFILTVCCAAVSAQSQNIPLGKFENDVRNYAFQSIADPPIPGSSLFIGSSSFKLWSKKLEERFAQYDAVNRGFGGSQMSHNIAALARIHLPYKPARVITFCGGNDLAAGKSVDAVFSDYKYYIARIWNDNPLTEIFYVSVSHAPVREKYWEQTDDLNSRMKNLAAKNIGIYYIDVVLPLNGDNGRTREDLFRSDRLHLNDGGYEIWGREFLKAFEEQDKDTAKKDIRELFKQRKENGFFDDPRFEKDGVAVKEPPEKDTKLNIVFIGDSITIGGADKSPPARCAEYLRKQAGIGEVAFSNQGVSGFTTVDFLPSKNKQYKNVADAAGSFNNREGQLLFSVMLGTNDSAVRGPNGSPVSPEQYRANVKEIVDKLLTDYPGSKIVLHRPLWYSETTQNSSTYLLEGQLRCTSYALELRALADDYAKTSDTGRVFLGDTKAYHYFKVHHLDTMNRETGGQGTFFLHPNRRGMDVLGRFWGAAIQNAL
ncbi:MAG: SGNH/GDSL hydrolase family protein [Planctomycetaceae bacterium]|jgi:lysophospholipase L1-like esterase|nr:SGNH/GDSL hydrolase family protein [Planctomycetaceae bacterium]